MALTTTDPSVEAGQTVRDRVAETARRMTDLSQEARAFTSRATDAVEDSVYATKRAMRRGAARLEDLQEEAIHRVKRQPLRALGLAVGIGLVLGIVVGWAGGRVGRVRN